MSKYYLVKLHFVLSICTLSQACDDHQSTLNDTLEANKSSIEVIDFSGQKIRLDHPAKRIVALTPHLVENVYSAGAGDQLVGVIQFSDFPEQATQLPIVGGYEKVNHEKILELAPDLILAWQSGNAHSGVRLLQELGFTVYIDQANSLEDVAKTIEDIGILAGTQSTATKVADQYLNTLKIRRQQYQDTPKLKAFYQVWNEPLQTINGDHIISDTLNVCGAENIFANEPAVAPIVNIESILERNPDIIVASGISATRPKWLDNWKRWPSLTAVQQDNLLFVNADHIQRHTVRLLLAIESLCEQTDEVREKLKLMRSTDSSYTHTENSQN